MDTWNKLRWPIKALIIAIPFIIVGYFATQKGWFNANKDTATQTDSTWSGQKDAAKDAEKESTKTTKADHRSFNYEPEKPVDGTLKGIVEVGASGFNSFVVNIDKDKRWEIVSKDFGKSLAYEGLATTDDIRTGLKNYIANMLDKGVKSKNIHFVISSGAQKVPKTTDIIAELKKMGYFVNLVTPEQEGQLALKSVLPPSYNSSAYVVDIGSGNTKISWYKGSEIKALEAPGAKYYEKELKDEEAYKAVKEQASKVPDAQREVCFIIGGVPFELANQIREGEERYTVLKKPSDYKGDKPKTKAGINIYQALVDGTSTDTFVFDWDANFSIGFLLTLPNK